MLYGFLTCVYLLTAYFRAKAAVYVYVGGFCVLSGYHIKRMLENYGGYEMDLTLVLMQQLIRVTYFAWAVHDRHLPAEQLPESSRGRVISKDPSLLEFLAYNFNFLGMLCPSPDYFDYSQFIEQTGNYAVVPLKPKSHLKAALKAVFCVVFYVLCSQLLPSPDDMISDEMMAKVLRAHQNFPLRFLLLNFAIVGFRSRYYVAWLLSQVAIDLAGLSFNQATGEFDKYEAARPWDVEWTHWDAKKRVLVGSGQQVWNMGTQRWLKMTFYERMEARLGKSRAALYTFILSSFWHGFYPSYYLAFFMFHVTSEVQRVLHKNQEFLLGAPDSLRRTVTEKALA